MEETEQKTLDRFSYSKISVYKQCPFKYLVKYKEKNFVDSSSIATEFGSLVHETEEAIAKALQAGEQIDYISLKNKFIIESRKLALKYPADFGKLDKSERTYREKVYLYLDSAIYRLEKFLKNNPNLVIIGIEQKFEYDYDGVHSFNGSIDRAFLNIDTGEILIQDIKTWSVPAQEAELKAPLQFAVYMMAAQQLWDTPFDKIKCEYDLPFCNIVQPALSNNIVEEGKEVLDKLFMGIQKENFKPAISALCHWCEYNPLTNPGILETKPEAVCPYFSTWQKSGDKVYDTVCKWEGPESIGVDRQLIISQLKQQNLKI
jgi:hypothetical protein